MLKTLSAVAVGIFLSFGPAFAQTSMDCTEEAMTKAQSDLDAMTGDAQKEQKEMAMKDLDKAKEAMAANSMEDCKAHMEKATKAMTQG